MLAFDKCTFYLDYILDGINRHYIPDLLIKYADDSKLLVEIKPSYKVNSEECIAKFSAAASYCSNNNMNFVVWTEKDLFANYSDYTNFLNSVKTA